jgi:AcrR family transcriptional regulator
MPREQTIERKRLSPDESRAVALSAAHDILLADGPQAVTLKAVAAKVGRTHANLLHHFGTALDLQKALAAMLAERVCASIADTVIKARRGEADPRGIVDWTFAAFDKQGAGALATWMIISGNKDALDPILTALHKIVNQLSDDSDAQLIAEHTLTLVFMALGDALLGKSIADALGLPATAARDIALRQILESPGLKFGAAQRKETKLA